MSHSPIAIVGMGCRFPQAHDLEAYRSLVMEGRSAIERLPAERFDEGLYFDPEVGTYGKSYCRIGGIIPDGKPDWRRFRMMPKTAENTDPVHFWGLDVTYQALEDARLDPFDLRGRNVGVVIGHARGSMLGANMAYASAIEGFPVELGALHGLRELDAAGRESFWRDLLARMRARLPRLGEDGGPSNLTSALASVIASVYGFTGRHMVVDAACASSFAAMDVAIRGLRQGRIDMAIAGGASYSQWLSVVMFAQSRALSAEGSFPFDARANGFISSDGVGLFVLMRLEDALREGRQIRGVLRGIGGSCDGKGKGLWAPRAEGQILAVERAWRGSGVDPARIGLLEAHGTSTSLGDATEIDAVTRFFSEHLPAGAGVPVGSVKGNIGHTREAAGAAGLIKVLLAFEEGRIPPSINYETANPDIQWAQTPFAHAGEGRPWPKGEKPRIAAVDAFGIGGLNYQVVVEEPSAPEKTQVPVPAPIPHAGDPIAIVGMGCVLPSARGPEGLWRLLRREGSGIREVPKDRWDPEIHFAPGDRQPYRSYARHGGFVTDFEPDWRRYRIPPKLVESNDPLQFMILESALDALEDAGLASEQVDAVRDDVGVVVGSVFGSDFAMNLGNSLRVPELSREAAGLAKVRGIDDAVANEIGEQLTEQLRGRMPRISEDSSGSFSSSTLSSRVAKTLDLHGPTFSVDAACASSLASLEAACEMLWSGDAKLVLFGGGDRSMRAQRFEGYCQFKALSHASRPRPFSSEADGFLPGEGAAICALMRLSDARAQGRRVYAIVRGIGSSSDGERKSLLRPAQQGLASAMKRALDQSEIEPERVRFVECHGAGTVLGDATEMGAIRQVYAPDRGQPIRLSSVKATLGHCQGAAGAASLMRAALSLHHRELPPTPGAQPPNEALGRELRADPDAVALEAGACAGVSAMGLGGINYHVILESDGEGAGDFDGEESARKAREPAVLRGESMASLMDTLGRLEHAPEGLTPGAAFGEGKAAVAIAGDAAGFETLRQSLPQLRDQATWPVLQSRGIALRPKPVHGRMCFMLPGQGSWYPGMLRAVCESYPGAAECVARIDAVLDGKGLTRLSRVMWEDTDRLSEVLYSQLSVLGGNLAMVEVARAHGLAPDLVTGHSYGDYAALAVTGAYEIEDAVAATLRRCEAIEATVTAGAMASVFTDRAQTSALLEGLPGFAAISNINAPGQTVVSGSPDAIDELLLRAERAGHGAHKLGVPRAFHCELMAPARAQLGQSLADLPLRAPSRPFLSSVGAAPLQSPEEIRDALVRQLVEPVDFIAQLRWAIDAGCRFFVELGPGDVLARLAKDILEAEGCADDCLIVSFDKRKATGLDAVEAGLRALRASQSLKGEARPLVAGAKAPVAGAGGSALFSTPQWDRLSADARFEPWWESARPVVADFARRLFEAQCLQAPVAAAEPELALFDATEKRRARLRAQSQKGVAPVAAAPAPAPTQAPAAGPAADEIRRYLLDQVIEQTGYPEELLEFDLDLEADLGVDTVKQAQIFSRVREHYGLEASGTISLRDFPTLGHVMAFVESNLGAAPQNAPEPGPAPETSAAPTTDLRVEVESKLVELICEQTGYPAELIEPDLDLEADLGIDTVKQAQVLAQAREIFGVEAEAGLALRDFPTLAKIADYIASRAGGAQTAPAEAPTPAPAPAAAETAPEPARQSKLPVLQLNGTPYEIGRRHGELQAQEIGAIVGRYEEFLGDERKAHPLLAQALAAPEEWCDAAALEEIRGVADGAGLPFRYVLAYNLDSALFPELSAGCTQVALQHSGRNAWHAVNEDSPLRLYLGPVLHRVVQMRRPTEGQPHVTFSHPGQIFGPNGVNAAGLAITSTLLLDREMSGTTQAGTLHPILLRQVLEHCETTQQAVDALKTATRTGAWSVLLTHQSEASARHLEYDAASFDAREEQAEHVSTNHGLRVAATAPIPEHSERRRERMDTLLAERNGVSPLSFFKSALRDRYDLGRGREVAHRTMNTVHRVDNVMSLVVDHAGRRLHVAGGEDDATWQTVDLEAFFSGGAFLSLPEAPVMQRFVLRPTPLESPPGAYAAGSYAPQRVLIIGGEAYAEALAEKLRARGSEVTLLPLGFDPETAELPADADICLLSAAAADSASDWDAQRARVLDAPYRLLQRWTPAVGACLSAVTALGGRFGQDNRAGARVLGGGVAGLVKALDREFEGLRCQLLDVEPSAAPEKVADALLLALDESSGPVEQASLRGLRLGLQLLPAEPAVELGQLPRLERVLLTGGARGITAEVAAALCQVGVQRLDLVGSTPLPPEIDHWRTLDAAGLEAERQAVLARLKAGGERVTPVQWERALVPMNKALEIDRTLQRLSGLGVDVHYHAADLADGASVGRIVSQLAEAHALPDALIHGAGYEVSHAFASKSPEDYQRTLGGKVEGLRHLLAALDAAGAPPATLVAFSSISGRFGGRGQADYSLASELMARMVGDYALAHPESRCLVMDWPAWDGTGMAVRKQTRHLLEAAGQAFMPVEEGVTRLLRELAARRAEHEVTIVEGPEAQARPALPLVDLRLPGDARIECHLDPAADRFLDEHRIGPTPILPAVVASELCAELGLSVGLAAQTLAVADLRIHTPLKVPEGQTVRLRAEGVRQDTGLAVELRADFESRGGRLVDPDRMLVEARVVSTTESPLPTQAPEGELRWVSFSYPEAWDPDPRSQAIFHGPVFRGLRRVGVSEGPWHVAEIEAPASDGLRPGRATPILPAPVLDCCLQGCGVVALATEGERALPGAFELLRPGRHPRAGERCTLHIQALGRDGKQIRFNFVLLGEDGARILEARGYAAHTFSEPA